MKCIKHKMINYAVYLNLLVTFFFSKKQLNNGIFIEYALFSFYDNRPVSDIYKVTTARDFPNRQTTEHGTSQRPLCHPKTKNWYKNQSEAKVNAVLYVPRNRYEKTFKTISIIVQSIKRWSRRHPLIRTSIEQF